MKKLIIATYILLAIVGTFLFCQAIVGLCQGGVEATELHECLKWEDQYSSVRHIEEIYDLPEWQVKQCEQHGIDLERFFK